MPDKFYITTPIFYPNARPHMGHAYTTVVSDILARYHRLRGEEVYFLTGVDENTEKVVRVAKREGQETRAYLDAAAGNFRELYDALCISFDQFIRTSDPKKHWPGATEIWKRIAAKGDFEKRTYTGLYCVGHEAFITEKDLVNGKCPDHDEIPERLKEENYFFKLSRYTEEIKRKIESNELLILPETRRNEILALLGRGLEDVSFSRPSTKVSVGVPVPEDPSQRMYVWCDALSNYISALGFGTEESSLFKRFWPADAHVIGKDILRFHTAIWPAMLLSAGLPLPKRIMVHGFITSGGKKMSKSLGNVIDPHDLIREHGSEAVRFFLARHISSFEDGDLTVDAFKEAYTSDLANGIGNLTSRIMRMSKDHLSSPVTVSDAGLPKSFIEALDAFNVQAAATVLAEAVAALDRRIQEAEPFKLVKADPEKGKAVIAQLVSGLYAVACMLLPILPATSEKIKALIAQNEMPAAPLFPRI